MQNVVVPHNYLKYFLRKLEEILTQFISYHLNNFYKNIFKKVLWMQTWGHTHNISGQIFDARRISATRISAPKKLAVVVNTKKNYSIQIETSFWR